MKQTTACLAFVAVALCLFVAAQDFDVRKHLASKTPYYPQQDFSQHTPAPAGCTPLHLNIAARHGTRNPSDGDIEDYDALIAQIQKYKHLIPDSLAYIKNWTNPFDIQDESKLVLLGRKEHYELAKRFKAAYPNIFADKYDTDIVFFRSTQESRAVLSADSFGYGLFERRGEIGADNYEPRFILSDTESQDYILKYYDNCPLYTALVDDNDDTQIEFDMYESLVVPPIASRLTTILGVGSAWNLTSTEALTAWAACQSEASLFEKYEWCSLFRQAEVEQLEYLEDLDDYYSKGYPYEINYRMTAPLLQDIFNSMKDAINRETRQKANLRFAHSSTIVSLLVRLGLFKDPFKLTHNLPQSQIDARVFRTSVLSPMATNLAAVLYECPRGPVTRHYIKFLVNEKEYTVQGCDSVYCPFEQFAAAYSEALNDNFEEVCALPEPKHMKPAVNAVPMTLNFH